MVDLDDQGLILFNYTMEDIDNPTNVKNSFSQQITIPGTPNNNKLFGDIFRLDRMNSSVVTGYGVGFNPSKKTPFAIYNELNEVLESGYVKLDSVDRKKSDIKYNISLFGGLGSFIANLSTKADGTKMSLADLDFLGTEDPESEFDYAINRTIVANAWDVLAGEMQNPLFEVINFAPCYNGIPADFSADKAAFDGSIFGYTGQLIANLSRDYTDMEAHDLRSYLQRPVIRFKAILEAIANPLNNGGYDVVYSDDVAAHSNRYWEDIWMTLPILDKSKRSGDTFTKRDLLGGTDTPANYLLSYCKMLGLKIIVDEKNKRVDVMTRREFFYDVTIDLSERIDISQSRPITPLVMDTRWMKMESSDDGEFAQYYEKLYGRKYGIQRIDTGYEFNTEEKDITNGIIFKGGVQVVESSDVFLDAYYGPSLTDCPAPFVNGGTYVTINPSTSESTEHQIDTGKITKSWWNQMHNGSDIVDYVQLHKEDNGALDGSNVLLFFTGMVGQPHLLLSDDLAMMGEEPCWNLSSVNTRSLQDIPHFSRFNLNDDGEIADSLDWGESAELYIDADYFDDKIGLYHLSWGDYLKDRMDDDTSMVRVKVNLSGMMVSADLLRNFYWFDGALWSLNKIINHSLTTWDDTECEFIKIQDTANYE